jgi:hypothetical protein
VDSIQRFIAFKEYDTPDNASNTCEKLATSAVNYLICLSGVVASMLPLETPRPYSLPLHREELSERGFGPALHSAQTSITGRAIFQPQPSRAGNAFLTIQEALKNDRVPLQRGGALNVLHSSASLPGLPARDFSFDSQLGSSGFDSSTDEDDDDYDYYKHSLSDQHNAGLSAHGHLSSDLPTSSATTSLVVRNWIKHFTPQELLSVNAACSVFSPGFNWPGNVSLRQLDLDAHSTKQQRASHHTIASLVLRAEAEKTLTLGKSQQMLNSASLVPNSLIRSQSAMSLASHLSQPVVRIAKQMPPPAMSPNQSSKGVNSPVAAKRARGARNPKQQEIAGVSSLMASLYSVVPDPVLQ